MSEFSRRTLVQLGALPLVAQVHSHEGSTSGHNADETGFRPIRIKFFRDSEFETLRTLCDLILPADDVSPAASAAGAPEYIELLASRNSRLTQIFRGGLAWINAQSYQAGGESFAKLPDSAKTALLDRITDKRHAAPADVPGAEFFDWVRKLTIDAFYTSAIGYKDVDYRGGKGMTTYEVPAAALEQALTKAKLK